MAQAVEESSELEMKLNDATNSIVEQEDDDVEDTELNQQPEVQVTALAKPITYQIIEGGTKKGADLLVDSLGYAYTKRSQTSKNVNWVCSSRSQKCHGRVSLIYATGTYKRGEISHSHPGDPNSALRSSVRAIIKKEANADGTSSTAEIARRTLESYQLEGEALSFANLQKSAYRARKNKDKIKIPEKEFQIVKAGSTRNSDLLVDKRGFTYTRRRTSKLGTIWICSKRTTKTKCYVQVSQPHDGEKFIMAKNKKHNHPGDPSVLLRTTIRAAVKEAASADSESTMVDITKRAIEGVDTTKLNVSVSSMQRAASRARQKMRKSLGIIGPARKRPGAKAGQLSHGETSESVGTINMYDTMAQTPSSLQFARSIALAPTTYYNPPHLPISAASSQSYITTVMPANNMGEDTYPTPASMPDVNLSRAEENLWEQARNSKILSTKGSMEAEWLEGLNNEGLITNWAIGIEPLPASIKENRRAMEGICRARRELGFTVQRIVADAMRKKAKVDGVKGDKSMKLMEQHMTSKLEPFEPLANYTTNIVSTAAVRHSYDLAMEYAKISSYQQPSSVFEDVRMVLNCHRDNPAEIHLSETTYSEGHHVLDETNNVPVSEPYVPGAPNTSTYNQQHHVHYRTHHPHGHTSIPDHGQSHDHDYTQEVCQTLSTLATQTQCFQSSSSNASTAGSSYLGDAHVLPPAQSTG